MLAPCFFVCAALVSQVAPETASDNDGLQWQADLAAAQKQAHDTNRLVLIHFGGPWCEPCQRLEKQVFSQPGFGRELQSKYVAVKIDPRGNDALAKKYAVRTVPTDVVITATGQLVYKVGSPPTAAAYIETMNRIAASALPIGDMFAASPGANKSATANNPAPESAVDAAHTPAPPAADARADRYADAHSDHQPNGPALQSAQPARPAAAAQPRANRPATGDRDNHLANAAQYQADVQKTRAAAPPHAAAEHVASRSRPAAEPHSGQPMTRPNARAAAGNPPLALDGYCPVTLVDKRQWQPGKKDWGAIHRGRTYLFASQTAQKAFLANPDRYSPVLSGNDPVMRLDHHRDVPGKREYGAFYNNRIYLFTSEDTFQRFDRDPSRYTVDARQAMRR